VTLSLSVTLMIMVCDTECVSVQCDCVTVTQCDCVTLSDSDTVTECDTVH